MTKSFEEKVERLIFDWHTGTIERDNHIGEIMSTDVWQLRDSLLALVREEVLACKERVTTEEDNIWNACCDTIAERMEEK